MSIQWSERSAPGAPTLPLSWGPSPLHLPSPSIHQSVRAVAPLPSSPSDTQWAIPTRQITRSVPRRRFYGNRLTSRHPGGGVGWGVENGQERVSQPVVLKKQPIHRLKSNNPAVHYLFFLEAGLNYENGSKITLCMREAVFNILSHLIFISVHFLHMPHAVHAISFN